MINPAISLFFACSKGPVFLFRESRLLPVRESRFLPVWEGLFLPVRESRLFEYLIKNILTAIVVYGMIMELCCVIMSSRNN